MIAAACGPLRYSISAAAAGLFAPRLSSTASCRMGVCGSCGMMVNGEPKLTCAAFLKSYYPEAIRVEPLSHFPVLRDLII